MRPSNPGVTGTDEHFDRLLEHMRAEIDRIFRKWTWIQCSGMFAAGCAAAAAIRWL